MTNPEATTPPDHAPNDTADLTEDNITHTRAAQGPVSAITGFVRNQWQTTSKKRKLITLLTLFAFAAFLTLLASGENLATNPLTFTAPDPPQPPPVTGTATTFLTDLQADEYTVIYSSLLAWSEVAQLEAITDGPNTLAYILASPSVRCAREHRALRNQVLLGQARAPESWMNHILDCARDDFTEQTETVLENWNKMNQQERTARATQALLRLWSSLDPALHTQAMLVFERRILPDPQNEKGFRLFKESYQPCHENLEKQANAIASADSTPTDVARTWFDEIRRMDACINAITEARFPLQTPKTEPRSQP